MTAPPAHEPPQPDEDPAASSLESSGETVEYEPTVTAGPDRSGAAAFQNWVFGMHCSAGARAIGGSAAAGL